MGNMLHNRNTKGCLLMIHFDILYIGNDNEILDYLQRFSKEYDLSVFVVKHLSYLRTKINDLSFTFVLTEQHIDYNYDGLTIEKLGINFSYLGILTKDLFANTMFITNKNYLETDKFFIQKNFRAIDSFIKSKPIPYESFQTPIEA